MNCPSRTDDTLDHPGWNQNPSPLNPDITTRSDFNGIANSRTHRKQGSVTDGLAIEDTASELSSHNHDGVFNPEKKGPAGEVASATSRQELPEGNSGTPRRLFSCFNHPFISRVVHIIVKFARFIGPGFMIAVSYIDPGNYSTDVAAGADFKYALLFVVLLSNLFAIFLQSLCVKLGSVTGRNLPEMCREHFPRWVVYILYFFSEVAIIATDISEVTA